MTKIQDFWIKIKTKIQQTPWLTLQLFLTALVVYIIGIVVPFIGWFVILPLGMVVVLIFAILGIINAAGGQMKPLPVIGKFQIIK